MNEYDSVVLNKGFEDLKAGVRGAIVLKCDESNFEVESFDDKHGAIGICMISAEYLTRIKHNTPDYSS